MTEFLKKVIERFDCGPAPTRQEYEKLVEKIDFPVDPDFLEWMQTCSEGSAFVASDRYLQFWRIADIVRLNPYYADIEEAKRVFFFATDGSNQGYGFEIQSGAIVSIDFLDIGYEKPEIVGYSFSEFMKNLFDGAAEDSENGNVD